MSNQTRDQGFWELNPCPFCSGAASWCSHADNEFPHDCHQIVCTGCGISVDLADGQETETIEGLRNIMAYRWNSRA